MLLDHNALEKSVVVANSRMNRERGAVGVNSYEQDVRLNPVAYLLNRLNVCGSTSWLDLCCGRGRALLETAQDIGSEVLQVGHGRFTAATLFDRRK